MADVKTVEQIIGENVKTFRVEMSQSELGHKLGELLGKPWSAQIVSRAEQGKRAFVASEILALAQILGCSVPALFRRYESGDVAVSDQFVLSSDALFALTQAITDDHLRRSVVATLARLEQARSESEQVETSLAALKSELSKATNNLTSTVRADGLDSLLDVPDA